MWRFEHPEYLWALVLIPILGWLFRRHQQSEKKGLELLGGLQRVKQLIPRYFEKRNAYQWSLFTAGIVFGILALANLQSGLKTQKIKREGIDVMLCLDVSNSMLATDLAPSRLERAKQWIARLLDAMPNNRVGLIVFAGHAYVSVPLTNDHAALKMNLADIRPEKLPTQGTSLGEALAMARERFNRQEARYKSIVLLSDGEDHDEAAIQEAATCLKAGIVVSTVGIGTPEGGRIPDAVNGGVKQDREGHDVITALNETILKDVAKTASGTYYPLSGSDATTLAGALNNTKKGTYEDIQTQDYNSYFMYFALLAFGCLLLEQTVNIWTVPKKERRGYA